MGNSEVAIIVGAGQGLSAALARLLVDEGAQVVLAARDVGKLSALVSETGARAVACDASDPDQVEALFSDVDAAEGAPSLVVFNPSRRVPGPLVEVDPETGKVDVLKYVAVDDVGNVINPMVLHGQIHGGIAHGVGAGAAAEPLAAA